MSILSEQQHSILMIVTTDDDPSAAVEQIELFKNGSVVVVADRFRLNDVISAFQRGTKAYFLKDASPATFTKYLDLLMMGETIVPREILSFILDRKDDYYQEKDAIQLNCRYVGINMENNHVGDNYHVPHLSNREKVIMRCLINGNSNKEIARKIDIREATVKVYIKAILRKIRVQNRTQAAIWATKNDSLIFAVDISSKTCATTGATPLRGSTAASKMSSGGACVVARPRQGVLPPDVWRSSR
jgi:DNA-binding NarL/FixJ family response regulator